MEKGEVSVQVWRHGVLSYLVLATSARQRQPLRPGNYISCGHVPKGTRVAKHRWTCPSSTHLPEKKKKKVMLLSHLLGISCTLTPSPHINTPASHNEEVLSHPLSMDFFICSSCSEQGLQHQPQKGKPLPAIGVPFQLASCSPHWKSEQFLWRRVACGR